MSLRLRRFAAEPAMARKPSSTETSSALHGIDADFGTPASAGSNAFRHDFLAPGSLVEQWRDEMQDKFGLDFRVFSRELEASIPSGNPFEDLDHLIVRLDQMTRNEELREKLCAAGWDLVVFGEARRREARFACRSSRRASLGAVRRSKSSFRLVPAPRRTPTHRRSFAIR